MSGDLNLLMIIWESGFIVKLVLLSLIIASVLSWAIILQKRKDLQKIELSNEEFFETFKNQKKLADIYDEVSKHKDSSLGLMFQKGYGELAKIKEKLSSNGNQEELPNYFRQSGLHAMERSLSQAVNLSNQILESRLSLLATIGSVSPFIGLFGTVWGIIDSFTGLAQGGGSIEAVAPGIAEALVATAVGLAAAIPAVWAYNIFTTRISKMNSEMENFGQDFLNLIERSILISKI